RTENATPRLRTRSFRIEGVRGFVASRSVTTLVCPAEAIRSSVVPTDFVGCAWRGANSPRLDLMSGRVAACRPGQRAHPACWRRGRSAGSGHHGPGRGGQDDPGVEIPRAGQETGDGSRAGERYPRVASAAVRGAGAGPAARPGRR